MNSYTKTALKYAPLLGCLLAGSSCFESDSSLTKNFRMDHEGFLANDHNDLNPLDTELQKKKDKPSQYAAIKDVVYDIVEVNESDLVIAGDWFLDHPDLETVPVLKLKDDGTIDADFLENIASLIDGEVFTLAVDETGGLWLGGNFSLKSPEQQATNLIRVDASGTLELPSPSYQGTNAPVKSIEKSSELLAVSGAFSRYDNQPVEGRILITSGGHLVGDEKASKSQHGSESGTPNESDDLPVDDASSPLAEEMTPEVSGSEPEAAHSDEATDLHSEEKDSESATELKAKLPNGYSQPNEKADTSNDPNPIPVATSISEETDDALPNSQNAPSMETANHAAKGKASSKSVKAPKATNQTGKDKAAVAKTQGKAKASQLAASSKGSSAVTQSSSRVNASNPPQQVDGHNYYGTLQSRLRLNDDMTFLGGAFYVAREPWPRGLLVITNHGLVDGFEIQDFTISATVSSLIRVSDGKLIVVTEVNESAKQDIWLLEITTESTARAYFLKRSQKYILKAWQTGSNLWLSARGERGEIILQKAKVDALNQWQEFRDFGTR